MSDVLWSPNSAQRERTALARYLAEAVRQGWIEKPCYADLHRWSLSNLGAFWSSVWDFCGVVGERGQFDFQAGRSMMEGRFFVDSRLNFAENLLRPWDENQQQLVMVAGSEQDEIRSYTRQQLLQATLSVRQYLQSRGVGAGDRVAGLLPHVPEAIIVMLAAASIGAIWSCCSPDFGQDAILDRFQQIAPKVFVTKDTCQYNGKQIDLWAKANDLISRLTSVESVICVGERTSKTVSRAGIDLRSYAEVEQQSASSEIPVFEKFPFNHPLYVLYSSGTTGVPKCIVHGAGGTLIQHAKELRLHADLQHDDRLFYYTGTGWMMWNWLVSGLQAGSTIALYDGSPLAPQVDSLFAFADSQQITHFGASAKYFAALDKARCVPRDKHGLEPLRVIMSTGSPLLPETFDYIYRDIKENVNVASISGGTDIVSCFVLGNPVEPVRRGEIQCAGLGMAVQIWDEEQQPIVDEPGELVCVQPFPSMPIGFWNDPQREAYRRSYFDRYPGVWCHGDWAKQTADGGYIIFGRSDATLNPGGIRIGTAEIYRQVETFEDIAESLATAWRQDGDEQIVLFLRMQPGKPLTPELIDQVKRRLRERCSPRHVPPYIVAVPDIPRTISGKISELAVRNAIHGLPIKNESALANPESLDFYRQIQLSDPL